MKLWKDSHEEVKKITPDRQMAKAILKMIEVRMKALGLKDRKEFASLVVEDTERLVRTANTPHCSRRPEVGFAPSRSACVLRVTEQARRIQRTLLSHQLFMRVYASV